MGDDDLAREIEDACRNLLQSHRLLRDRTVAIEQLEKYLHKRRYIKVLDNNTSRISWKHVASTAMDFVRSDIQKISSSKGKGRSTAANIDKINESFQVFALVVKKAEDSGPVLNTIIIPILTELLGHLENPKLQQSLDPSAMLTILQILLQRKQYCQLLSEDLFEEFWNLLTDMMWNSPKNQTCIRAVYHLVAGFPGDLSHLIEEYMELVQKMVEKHAASSECQRSEPFRQPHLFATIAHFIRRYPMETLNLMYTRTTLASKLLLWTATSLSSWHSDSEALVSSMVSVLHVYISQSVRHGWGRRTICRLPERDVLVKDDCALMEIILRKVSRPQRLRNVKLEDVVDNNQPDRIVLARHVALVARVLALRHRMCSTGVENSEQKSASPVVKMLEKIRVGVNNTRAAGAVANTNIAWIIIRLQTVYLYVGLAGLDTISMVGDVLCECIERSARMEVTVPIFYNANIQLWALKILSLMIALELRHRANYATSAFLRASSQLWARVWPGVVAVMRRHAWTRGYAALSKVGLHILSVFLRCGFVQPVEVLRSQKHLVHIIDEGVKARALFPQLLLSFMRVLPLETTNMNRELLLQSQCSALMRELDPGSGSRVDSACELVRRLTELFGRLGLFVRAIKVLVGDQIDSSGDEQDNHVAFAMQELHEAMQTNSQARARNVHAPDSFDLTEEAMIDELERTLFANQPMHISLMHIVHPVDTLLDVPPLSSSAQTSRASPSVELAHAEGTVNTVEIPNDVSSSLRAQLMKCVVSMFRSICKRQTEHLQKLFPKAKASSSLVAARSGKQRSPNRSQRVAIILSHVVLLLQIIIRLLSGGQDSPESPVQDKQLRSLSTLKDKLATLFQIYLPHLAKKETAKDESAIFLLMSVLRFYGTDVLADESMDRDLGKILYQVLAMQYRDLVRPHMTGAKSVVDDFDLDRANKTKVFNPASLVSLARLWMREQFGARNGDFSLVMETYTTKEEWYFAESIRGLCATAQVLSTLCPVRGNRMSEIVQRLGNIFSTVTESAPPVSGAISVCILQCFSGNAALINGAGPVEVCKLFGDYISRRHDDHSLRRVLVAICQAAKLACKNADTFASREFSAYGELLKQIAGFVFGESKLGVRATTSKALLLAYASWMVSDDLTFGPPLFNCLRSLFRTTAFDSSIRRTATACFQLLRCRNFFDGRNPKKCLFPIFDKVIKQATRGGKAMEFAQCKFLSCAEVARFGLTQNARLQALAQITFQLRNPDLQWFAHSMLKVMVRVSECLTVEALLQEHMAFLVQSWLALHHCMEGFPLCGSDSVLGTDSLETFAEKYAYVLVPEVCLHPQRQELVEELVTLLNLNASTTVTKGVTKLIQRHIGSVYGAFVPLYFTKAGHSEARKVQSWIDALRVQKKWNETNYFDSMVKSFDILCDGAVGQHRHCTEVSVQKGFNFLTEKFKAKAVHVLMERANCFKVLQHLYQRYLQRSDVDGRKRVLLAYGVFIRVMDERLMSPENGVALRFAFTSLTHIWQQANDDSVRVNALKQLLALCNQSCDTSEPSQNSQSGYLLGPLLRSAATAFVGSSKTRSANSEEDSLLTKIRSQLSKGISDDSNMSVSVFCAHALSETCSNADLWEMIEGFLRSAVTAMHSKNFLILERFLRVLHSQLASSDCIATSWDTNGQHTSRQIALLKELVVVLVSISTSSRLYPYSMQLVAARVLSLLSTVSPDTVSLSEGSARLEALGEVDISTTQTTSRNVVWLLPTKTQIVQHLDTYLSDPDPIVVAHAAKTLTAILMTTSGEKILEKLNTESTRRDLEDNEEMKYHHLEFFTSKLGRSCLALTPHFDVNDQQSMGADNAHMLFSDEMWMKNDIYTDWLCRLTPVLVDALVEDEVLRECKAICALKPDFAAVVFPFCVLDAVRKDSASRTVANSFRQYFGQILCNPDSSHDVLRLVLACVQLLHRHHVESLARARASNIQYPLVPHLDVAAAALRCELYLTAFLHVEMFLNAKDKDNSSSNMAPPSANPHRPRAAKRARKETCADDNTGGDTMAKVAPLLREICKHLHEPDTILGVPADYSSMRGLGDRVSTYDILGQSRRALFAYDALLQTRNTNLSASPPTADPSVGLARALQREGLSHVLHLCLDSLLDKSSQSASAPSGELMELRYQAAYRACEWGPGQWALSAAGLAFSESTGFMSEESSARDSSQLTSTNTISSFDKHPSSSGAAQWGFHRCLFRGLQHLRVGNKKNFATIWRKGLETVLKPIRSLGQRLSGYLDTTEDSKSVYDALTQLKCLSDLQTVWEMRLAASEVDLDLTMGSPLMDLKSIQTLADVWVDEMQRMQDSFDLMLPLLEFREVLLKVCVEFGPKSSSDVLHRYLLELAKVARQAHRYPVALRLLSDVKARLLESGKPKYVVRSLLLDVQVEKARSIWGGGDAAQGISMLKDAIACYQKQVPTADETDTEHFSSERCGAILSKILVGSWLAKSKAEGSSTIHEKYLQSALEDVKSTSGTDPQLQGEVFLTLASYFDRLYQTMREKISSPEWIRWKAIKADQEAQLAKCNQAIKKGNKSTQIKSYKRRLEKTISIYLKKMPDESRARHMLHRALDYYLQFLAMNTVSGANNRQTPDSSTSVVFRVCGLWFGNSSDVEVNAKLRSMIDRIPKYAFLPLTHQIASHLEKTAKKSTFHENVDVLLHKMACQHPYHVVPILFALKYGDRVPKNRQGLAPGKIKAAQLLLRNLSKKSSRASTEQMKQQIQSFEILSRAYREVAPLGENEGLSQRVRGAVPKDLAYKHFHKLLKGLNHKLAAVVTAHIAVKPDGDYSGLIHILRFDKKIGLTSCGITRPKVILCLGSDGRTYKQLAKKDDVKQDAIMEQVFGVVNSFFARDRKTRQRNLKLRTYKVVPLAPNVGVLEWVQNTTTLADYLFRDQTSSAHSRYHPKEWNYSRCFKYAKAAALTGNVARRVEAFKKICANCTPVFQHYFFENYPDATTWYRCRLNYVRSVATTSIVGYVLGIGDRHSQNILLDTRSAELVHCDFGVVFEQGLELRNPERVPFRLTRDIVAGMGYSGTSGVFRRCCEDSLEVLRQHTESLLTILQVFIHDPLYRWTLSPPDILQRQVNDETEIDDAVLCDEKMDPNVAADLMRSGHGAWNVDASRVLQRVRQKLRGQEDPLGEPLAVSGQVSYLINAAQDPENLAQMFYGWAPWV